MRRSFHRTPGIVVALALSVGVKAYPATEFSGEVTQVLNHKIAQLTEQIAQHPAVLQAIRDANDQHQNLSLDEIQRLDAEWMSADVTHPAIKRLLTNVCAESLLEFQETHTGFSEILVTDRRGLVVAATNQTSEYYQADEEWWLQAYAEGRGHTFYSELEYDESAMTEAISVYVPIMDSRTQEVIGVLKGALDITTIKMEL